MLGKIKGLKRSEKSSEAEKQEERKREYLFHDVMERNDEYQEPVFLFSGVVPSRKKISKHDLYLVFLILDVPGVPGMFRVKTFYPEHLKFFIIKAL